MIIIFLKFLFINHKLFSLIHFNTEVGVNKNTRPRKKQGGGGYGYFKNMNNSGGANQMHRSKVYRQAGNRGKDGRQFAR